MKKSILSVILIGMIIPAIACSRKCVQPIERVEVLQFRDTLHAINFRLDSIIIKDSTVIVIRGDTILTDRWHTSYRERLRIDTVERLRLKTEYRTVTKTREVERGRTVIEKTLLTSGVIFLLLVVLFIIRGIFVMMKK